MKKIVLCGLIAIMSFCLSGCKSSDYKTAVQLMESKEYSKAATAFEKLGDYKDSADLLADCKEMLDAIAAFDEAVKALDVKNTELEAAISSADAVVHSEGKALDETLRPSLETAISHAKAGRVSVPERPQTPDEITAKAAELADTDYSSLIESLKESQTALQESLDKYALVDNPSESYVISCLETIPGITGIAAATEDNDPNGKLGKAGGYTAAVFFSHENVDLDPYVYGYTIIEQGTDAGGQIEVYANEEDAVYRNDYLSGFDGSFFKVGSHTVIGTCVIRTSDMLKASQQKSLEAELIEALTSLD